MVTKKVKIFRNDESKKWDVSIPEFPRGEYPFQIDYENNTLKGGSQEAYTEHGVIIACEKPYVHQLGLVVPYSTSASTSSQITQSEKRNTSFTINPIVYDATDSTTVGSKPFWNTHGNPIKGLTCEVRFMKGSLKDYYSSDEAKQEMWTDFYNNAVAVEDKQMFTTDNNGKFTQRYTVGDFYGANETITSTNTILIKTHNTPKGSSKPYIESIRAVPLIIGTTEVDSIVESVPANNNDVINARGDGSIGIKISTIYHSFTSNYNENTSSYDIKTGWESFRDSSSRHVHTGQYAFKITDANGNVSHIKANQITPLNDDTVVVSDSTYDENRGIVKFNPDTAIGDITNELAFAYKLPEDKYNIDSNTFFTLTIEFSGSLGKTIRKDVREIRVNLNRENEVFNQNAIIITPNLPELDDGTYGVVKNNPLLIPLKFERFGNVAPIPDMRADIRYSMNGTARDPSYTGSTVLSGNATTTAKNYTFSLNTTQIEFIRGKHNFTVVYDPTPYTDAYPKVSCKIPLKVLSPNPALRLTSRSVKRDGGVSFRAKVVDPDGGSSVPEGTLKLLLAHPVTEGSYIEVCEKTLNNGKVEMSWSDLANGVGVSSNLGTVLSRNITANLPLYRKYKATIRYIPKTTNGYEAYTRTDFTINNFALYTDVTAKWNNNSLILSGNTEVTPTVKLTDSEGEGIFGLKARGYISQNPMRSSISHTFKSVGSSDEYGNLVLGAIPTSSLSRGLYLHLVFFDEATDTLFQSPNWLETQFTD